MGKRKEPAAKGSTAIGDRWTIDRDEPLAWCAWSKWWVRDYGHFSACAQIPGILAGAPVASYTYSTANEALAKFHEVTRGRHLPPETS